VLYDPVTFSAPAFQVSALVADPRSGEPQRLYVRACVPAADGRCPADQGWDARAEGSVGWPAEIALRLPPERIRAALEADPLDGYGGVRVQLELEVRGGSAAVTASKMMLFSPALPGYVPNHGCSVTGFMISGSGGDRIIPDGGILELPVSETAGLRPLLSAGAAETYQVTDLAGRTVELTERISYSFFSTAHVQFGPLGHPVPGSDVADEPAPGDPVPEGGLVTLTALSKAGGRLWVVARDGRGAEAWAIMELAMPDKRGCSINVRCPTLDFGCL
jgi:hypothetical protein